MSEGSALRNQSTNLILAVQGEGSALRMTAAVLRKMTSNGRLLPRLLQRYSYSLCTGKLFLNPPGAFASASSHSPTLKTT
jgi:hypothetical protein